MKILHVNTDDMFGGAAIAAHRLHMGLRRIGIDSKMAVRFKESDEDSIQGPSSNIAKSLSLLTISLSSIPKYLYPKRSNSFFSIQYLPDLLIKTIEKNDPDLIHLHWICRGYVNPKTISKIKLPVVWTLHDMWPFTGGCHYSGGCRNYESNCGHCPQLGSKGKYDLSWYCLRRKRRLWNTSKLHIVTPSNWMMKCARKSSLFREKGVCCIPNGLDLDRFRYHDKSRARDLFQLPKNKLLILFGAVQASTDSRKGFQFLGPVLERLQKSHLKNKIELVVFGASTPANPYQFGCRVTYLGKIFDEILLPLIYSAADLFLAPSTEDNLPNTMMEAMACGVPCVAFNVGGISDMIRHRENGYLADHCSVEDMANGIQWVLEDQERWESLSKNAVRTIRRQFDLSKVAEKYTELYRSALHAE